jgi:hypothetical protein
MVKWLERPTSISMVRGSNPGLVIGIFLQYFIISAILAPSLNHTCLFPLKYPRMLKLIQGCIGSSGNVRVGRLAIGLS